MKTLTEAPMKNAKSAICNRCGYRRGHHKNCGARLQRPEKVRKIRVEKRQPSTASFILRECFIPSMTEPSCQNESGSVPSVAEEELEFDGGKWRVRLERLK